MRVYHQPDVYSATAPDGETDTRFASRKQVFTHAVAVFLPAHPDYEETLISSVTGKPFTVVTKARARDTWRIKSFSGNESRARAEVRRWAKKGYRAVVVEAAPTFLCPCDRCAASRSEVTA